MFSEQILSGFHEGVKALRLGVGKHLFAVQVYLFYYIVLKNYEDIPV